jgi:Zn-dependent M28 family amino/carboxypeptidase
VVAVLPGSDPQLRNEYVVLSAHFDHVGVGRPDADGDSIYNGADDDASGTSVMLAVARALSQLPTKPARSVMFLAVSGEEKGLLGSAYYVDHPTVPLERIRGQHQHDMVGRNHPDTLIAIGQEYSSLGPLTHRISTAHPELRFTIAPDLDPKEQVFFRSDHFNFARKQIPAIFFTTEAPVVPIERTRRPNAPSVGISRSIAAIVALLVQRLVVPACAEGHRVGTSAAEATPTSYRLHQITRWLKGAFSVRKVYLCSPREARSTPMRSGLPRCTVGAVLR